ncbi:ATP synthase F(0) complex subunit j, mitochondrial [Petromyzon marinus]|uniref:ATP synthase subunit ATP5MPL, mitochondrial n=1 Tax=Petromyzon marinus TaxID=7757 RepID=A0AAJ7WVL6_PETMA|nr:ATP synthase subunit ATP5MPL, mitochondrial [Petromyzon marinus]
MSGFALYWSKMRPYYLNAHPQVWVGVGVMFFLYYKLSFGGNKAVKSSSTGH